MKVWEFRTLTGLGALALLLVLCNGWLFSVNRSAQQEINARQQFVQQSGQLEVLYRDIVKALAELAVKNNDSQIIQMLGTQGINVSVNAPTAPALAVAPVAKR